MLSKAFFVLVAVAVAVKAQSNTTSDAAPTPTESACIYACIIPAAIQNGCSGIEDLACVCTNAQFQSDATACLQQHCPAADLQGALQLQQQACTAGGLTPSFSATPTPRPVSFTSVPGSTTVPGSSTGSGVSKPSPASSGSSVSRSATGSVVAASGTPSTAAGHIPQAGAGAIFGAILAGVFAL